MNKKVVTGIVFGASQLLYYIMLGKTCYEAGYDKGYDQGYKSGFGIKKHKEEYFDKIRQNPKETESN